MGCGARPSAGGECLPSCGTEEAFVFIITATASGISQPSFSQVGGGARQAGTRLPDASTCGAFLGKERSKDIIHKQPHTLGPACCVHSVPNPDGQGCPALVVTVDVMLHRHHG